MPIRVKRGLVLCIFSLDAPKCSYKSPQRVYAAVGEKVLLLCDMAPFPEERNLEFEWKFLGLSGKKKQILRSGRILATASKALGLEGLVESKPNCRKHIKTLLGQQGLGPAQLQIS